MSDGSVHAKASLFLAAGFSLAFLATQNPSLIRCAGGALAGMLVAPDLDLSNGGIVGGNLIRKKVGWFGERLWKFFWKGYSDSFSHGSWASHFPVFGTFVRLAYIYFWTVLPFYGLAYLVFIPLGLHWYWGQELLWWVRAFLEPMFFYGLASSDLIHFFLDLLTTKHVEKTVTKHLGSFKHNMIKG